MASQLDLGAFIRDVPDFPKPGIMFKDITPLLREPSAFEQALSVMTALAKEASPDAIVAIESRGFLFGAPIASRLSIPFVPIRKPGKLPAEHVSIEYALEYGTGQLEIHADALTRDVRVVIVDDVLATGGTALGAAHLIEGLGALAVGFVFLLELTALGGRKQLQGYEVCSVLSFPVQDA